MNVRVLKEHIRTSGCLGESYSNRNYIILEDLYGPVYINAGKCTITESMSIWHDNEVTLARKLCDLMKNRDHNAFAFYMLENDNRVLKFITMKV